MANARKSRGDSLRDRHNEILRTTCIENVTIDPQGECFDLFTVKGEAVSRRVHDDGAWILEFNGKIWQFRLDFGSSKCPDDEC